MSDRSFADPARTDADLSVLDGLWASLRERVDSGLGGGSWETDGESHWLVVPDLDALTQSRPIAGVGFFGQARGDVDHAPIVALEHDLLERASDFPGLLAYYNVRFAAGDWGNLVLFVSENASGHVRGDSIHARALALTPRHYNSVRLHRLRFPDGTAGDAPPALASTLLIDFSEVPPWRAVRNAPAR